jgi:serine/threonine-protein kinase
MSPTSPTAVSPCLTDRAAFLGAVKASGLLTASQLAKATAALPDHAVAATQAAQFLVATGFLTRFQADRLLAGRTDGFVIDPYVIQEQIGRGGAGRVYRAIHRTMSRTVAIKVLSSDLTRTPDDRAAFRREAQAAARLNHPNVVTAFDAHERGERAYVVTEFVDGPNLDQLVRDRGPLPVGEACELVRQVAVGLQHAHEQAMTHRAVKPTNLLVTRASKTMPGCVVKVADFGIARLTPPADPAAGDALPPEVAGALDYAAPEPAGDHRADLYSLGCVFYFLLTGRPPFPGGAPESKARRHRSEAVAPVGRVRPDVQPQVAEIVHRLLAKDPNHRFQSAAALAARLDGLSSGSVAVEEDGTFIHFDVPEPVNPLSYHSGHLTGMIAQPPAPTSAHSRPGDTLPDPSPWVQLTHEEPASGTGSTTATGPRRRGLTPMALLVTGGSVAAAAMLGAGFLLRAFAR